MPAPGTSLAAAATTVTANGAGAFSLTLTTRPFNTTDLILVALYVESAAAAAPVITDSTGATWTTRVGVIDAGNGQTFYIYERFATTSDINNAITYFVTAASLANNQGIMWSLVVQLGQFDAVGTTTAVPTSGTPYSLSTASVTPATSTDLAVACFNLQQSTVQTAATTPTNFVIATSDTASFSGVGSSWMWHATLASNAAIQPQTTPTFSGPVAATGAVLLYKPLGQTQSISKTDTADTTSDSPSFAVLPGAGTIVPDTGVQMSETVRLVVTTHTSGSPFVPRFRRGNWL